MTNTQGVHNGNRFNVWLQQAVAWALGVTAAMIPLYFTLQNDRDLQRTELGISDQHTAYTDVLNAADELILPRYTRWDLIDRAGGEGEINTEQWRQISEDMAASFPEEAEYTRVFQEAATRLRLVIPAQDAYLISRLTESLETTGSTNAMTPIDRVNIYSDAKLMLVNEFRADILGEDPLPDNEGQKLNAQTLEGIRLRAAIRGATEALRDLAESSESTEGTP